MTDAVRRITSFDFSGDDAHVALVDKAANGRSTIIMKSEEAPKDESIQDESITLNPEQEDTNMSDETIVKAEESADLGHDIKLQIKKAVAQAQADAKVEMQKALDKKDEEIALANEANETIAKARDAEILKSHIRKALNYTEFGVENTQKFAKAMMAVSAVEGGKLILDALEKAASMNIEKMDFQELGVTIAEEEAPKSGLMKALESQTK